MRDATNDPRPDAEARRPVDVLPADISAADMYLRLQSVMHDEDIPEGHVDYVIDVMNVLDTITMLADLDGDTRRDVIGIFTLFDVDRPDALHETLYRSALHMQTNPPAHLDGTTADGRLLAAGLRAIASGIETAILHSRGHFGAVEVSP